MLTFRIVWNKAYIDLSLDTVVWLVNLMMEYNWVGVSNSNDNPYLSLL